MALPSLRYNIFLIGDIDVQIMGNKLPSKQQVLKLLFFYTRVLNQTIDFAISAVIEEVTTFWRKAQIPTQYVSRCKKKLKDLYTEWRNINKHKDVNISKQNEFSKSLKNLFDIAHGDALTLIDEKKQNFLLNQRKDGRIGYIANIRSKYDEQQEQFNEALTQETGIL